MDRNRSQKNIRSALALAAGAVAMFGLTFYVAILYVA